MSAVNEVRLSVSRTVNLGNYESTKIEAGVTIARNDDRDTPHAMRERAIEEAGRFLDRAMREFLPEDR